MTDSAENIFDAWTIYDRVLDANVMFHQEIFRNVALILAERFGDRAITVLDLGCGSARHIASALSGRNLTRYVGYDLSQSALDHAGANLAPLGCPVKLAPEDLVEGTCDFEGTADVIFSAFAVHHLSLEDKAALFHHVADKLAAAGVFLYVDAVREEGEDRAAYLGRYCGNLRNAWRMFSQEELDEIVRHITENDFPETASTLRNMAADAGLTWCRETERFGWHRTFCFGREK